MRVAILGIGGLGRTLASELRGDPRVSSLLLVDRLGDRARVLSGIKGRVPIDAVQMNVENTTALVQILRGADLVVNAILPRYNLGIMQACLEARADYVDVAAAGPSRPGGELGIFEQLHLDDAFRAAGRTALLDMGLDPGMSNVLAREAADRLDGIDAIRIRSGDTARVAGFTNFPLYSREAFLDDLLVRPTVWADGALVEREPISEEEVFTFPDPVGLQRMFLQSHEEIKTLPRFLGRPVGRVDYKAAMDPNLAQAILSLHRLGLLAESRTVHGGGVVVPFRRVLLSVLPEPSALLIPVEGAEAMSVEVEGSHGGERWLFRRDIVMTHQEANRRRSTNAVYCLTAASLGVAFALFAEKALPRTGVIVPELLDPVRVMRDWESRGMPVARSESRIGS
ncbi:MAG TPA: saccharopine dehydrogenase NADP-binding domain-containing protein [Thermoplasmata archaeon]|jgi:saccharopine dehydrogenase (NAD+, L-lysine-forming)